MSETPEVVAQDIVSVPDILLLTYSVACPAPWRISRGRHAIWNPSCAAKSVVCTPTCNPHAFRDQLEPCGCFGGTCTYFSNGSRYGHFVKNDLER